MNRTSDQPFRSRAEREQEKALQEQYRGLGNPQVRAAAMLLGGQRQQAATAEPAAQQQG